MSKYIKACRYIELDEGLTSQDFVFLHYNILAMISFTAKWCKERNINFKITSMVRSPEQDKLLKAKSKTHQQGRAIDISLRKHHGWTSKLIQEFEDEFYFMFGEFGAISSSTGDTRPIVIHENHDGEGTHAHLQVRP